MTEKRKPAEVITKIRTGTGDNGRTYVGTTRPSKGSPIVMFMADLQIAQAAVGGLYQRFTDYEGAELVRDMTTMLYEVGGAVNAMHTVVNHVDDDVLADQVLRQYDKLAHISARLSMRQEALERALERLVGEGLRLPGFLTTVGSDSPDTALATGFVRRLECSFVASEDNGLPRSRQSVELRDKVRVLLNTMSDVLFALDYRSRSDSKHYWVGFGDVGG
jgi:cob(I)alamin adenosyltransferase